MIQFVMRGIKCIRCSIVEFENIYINTPYTQFKNVMVVVRQHTKMV